MNTVITIDVVDAIEAAELVSLAASLGVAEMGQQ
jgi:hypothetical protein